jgi:hypothetical protein
VVASSHMRTALLANGRFVTAIASAMLQIGVLGASIKALPVTLPGQYRNVAIVTLMGRSLSPVAQLFIESAREVTKPLAKRKRSGPCRVLALHFIRRNAASYLLSRQ